MCVCIEDDGKKLNNEKMNKRKKNIQMKKNNNKRSDRFIKNKTRVHTTIEIACNTRNGNDFMIIFILRC